MSFIKVLIVIGLVLTFLLCISPWIKLKPPASVLITAFRMPYQMVAKHLGIILMTYLGGYYLFILISKNPISKFAGISSVVVVLCIISTAVYCFRITFSKAQISGQIYQTVKVNNKQIKSLVEDLREKTDMKQFKFYQPIDVIDKGTCIVYLNYGGWSEQNEGTATYLRNLSLNQGYSYAHLVGMSKEDGSIDVIVKDIIKGLAYLKNEKQMEKLILVGGSAGGHLSLLTAFSNAYPEVYGSESIKVDGVIALYPIVDVQANYDLFVGGTPQKKNLLQKLGDAMYCATALNATTGTLSGETEKIMDCVFGKEADVENNFYKTASVKNMINVNLDIPVLIIQGSHDTMLSVEDKRELFCLFKEQGRNASYLELPNLDHAFDVAFADYTVQGKRTKKEIISWLNAYGS